jgi:hypothetical protein
MQNKFVGKKGRGRPSAGIPYRIQNGNFGFYFPKRLYGLVTSGHKLILDLKTKNRREALERIEAMGLVLQIAACTKETF